MLKLLEGVDHIIELVWIDYIGCRIDRLKEWSGEAVDTITTIGLSISLQFSGSSVVRTSSLEPIVELKGEYMLETFTLG